jgi:N-acetylneuraminic acid mutarotase
MLFKSRFLLACLAGLTLLGVAAPTGTALAAPPPAGRAASQAAVERVLWAHRIWPSVNPQPKPALEAVMTDGDIRAKFDDVLRMSSAVERFTGRAISGADLQAEVDRQARDSKQPDLLRELWAALGNDPRAVAETLARPIVAERLLRAWYGAQGDSRPFEAWWASVKPGMSTNVADTSFGYSLPSTGATSSAPGTWDPTFAIPEGNIQVSSVWTGTEMIIWGGTESGQSKFNSGSRYDPATDTWRTTGGVNAPFPRKQHSAIWTGTEMIVWGGCGLGDEHSCQINSGGRYDPASDTWTATATAGAPQARIDHTAVWTGSRMVIWGGCRFSNDVCSATALGNSGGRYDPASNTWQATATAGAPAARTGHTSVWTGSEMIVWGGAGASVYADGARYDPVADTWTPTAALPQSVARYFHTAVWTGSQMIVWGGNNASTYFNSGARYSPATDKWRKVSTAGAPPARSLHTAVWTGSQMIVWGGCDSSGLMCGTQHKTGGRYNPATDSWTTMSTAGAPSARSGQEAVWTGSLMIVWGGNGVGDTFAGGRYDPATDSWTSTNAMRTASAREWHSAIWTGTEMIVWGGDDRFNGTVNTGSRYTPATDTWQATSTTGAPSGRFFHSAIWTGTHMIIWGGQYGSTIFKDGGRYNAATNTWQPTSTTGAPVPRANHTAVWTGTQMIVWGGSGNVGFMNTGGRYDPVANAWTPTATAGAPQGRYLHTAVWTGSDMIVWGGSVSTGYTNTGSKYDPVSNTWTAITTTGAPEGRYSNALVWTGSKMIVWGGAKLDSFGWTLFRTGGVYDPVANAWTATTLTNAPIGRLFFASGWTGSALVVWGGCTVDSACSASTYTGGEYNPATNSWVATSLIGAPSARGKLAGVWTGTEFIVWGGSTDDSSTFTYTGGRYTPLTA